MKVIDLSHMLDEKMPVYPGTESPIFTIANTIEKDGFLETKFTMYSHTGTHIDAPAHLLKAGLTLDKLEVEQFIGTATIIDLTELDSSIIQKEDLLKHQHKLANIEFVILNTGWDKYWGENKYFEGFPSLAIDAAQWLAGLDLKGVGIDAISIDNINSKTLPVHHIFLKKNMIIIENLTNLNSILSENFIFSCMPLKNKNADGSPVRAIAIENISSKEDLILRI